MRFNLSQSLQSRELEYSIKARLYSKLLKASKHKATRIAGPGVGVVSGILTLASRIGLIFENVIKGIINILGAPLSKRCSSKKGFRQLFANAPGHIVSIPYTLFCAVFELFSKTIPMMTNPEKYCSEKYSKFAGREVFN